jgi:hypothetical protein
MADGENNRMGDGIPVIDIGGDIPDPDGAGSM